MPCPFSSLSLLIFLQPFIDASIVCSGNGATLLGFGTGLFAHRRWMVRSYVLICSAVALRLISGTAGLVGVPSPEHAYICAAWISWLLPLAAYEIIERWPAQRASELS